MRAIAPPLAVLAAALAACAGAGPASRAAAPGGAPVPAPPAARTAPAAPAPASDARYGPEPRTVPTPVEVRAAELVRARFPGARPSGALALAARDLAAHAARGDASLARDRLRGALARGRSYDAAPAAYSVAGGADAAPAALARTLPDRGRATHYGVGAAEDAAGRTYLVVLAAERKASLSPFPREVAPGAAVELAGALEPPLLQPRVFVTLPSGEVREAEVVGGRAFRARTAFPEPGRYLVEVVAQSGPRGPEVAALLTVSAGGAPLERAAAAPDATRPADAADLRAGEGQVIDAINALRRRRGLRPLAPDPALSAVARAHSARMAELRTLAHVLPGSGDLGERLRRAGVPYARALENVALAGGALAAHGAAEESPAHLGNIVDRGVTRVGVGAAVGEGPGGAASVYLTEVFVERGEDADAARAPQVGVREVLWRERARAGQPPLTADPRLDALAQRAAERMRDAGDTDPGDLGQRALGLGRRLSAVDVFVGSGAAGAVRSANVRDGRFRRVGVGVARGDSARFGAGRLWIAVVLTD